MTTLGNGAKSRSPTGMKVAPQSYAKLEVAANELRPMLPLADGKFMLDAWRVLEQTLPRAGYSYRIEEVHDLQDCAAFTIPDDGLVVMRQDVYDGLFTGSVFARSTVIHELCHIVLQHHVTLHRGAVLGQHRFFEDSEWQAKAMTAAVMMSLAACKAAHDEIHLAEICGTSVEAAKYRLDRLVKDGLIEQKKGFFW